MVSSITKGELLAAALFLALLLGCGKRAVPPEGDAPTQQAERPAVAIATEEGVQATPGSQTKAKVYSRLVAVCVGTDSYDSIAFGATRGAERDADAVANVLSKRYGFETVVLKGKAATRAAILGAIQKYTKELGDRDALVVFFAGHGYVVDLPSYGRNGYLIPYDADLDPKDTRRPEEWTARAIDMRGLVKSVEDAPVSHVLFVVDACCSGFMTRRGDLAARQDLQELLAGRSRTVIAATTEQAPAVPADAAERGKFSLALTELLEKYEDAQSVTDLFLEVRKRVISESRRVMHPQRGDFAEASGEFVFVPASISEGQVQVALATVKERAQKRTARRTTDAHFAEVFDATNYRFGPNPVVHEKLWRQKLERFRENAAQGEHLALAAEALCEAKGLGTDVDPARAYRRALLAYETRRPEGIYALAYCLLNGIGTPKNFMGAQRLVLEALEVYPDRPSVVLNHLHDMMISSRESSHASRRAKYEAEAKTGIVITNIRVAQEWIEVDELPDKDRKALTPILTELADAGNPLAQYCLYRFATIGKRTPTEDEKKEALRRLEQSADQGYSTAQVDLAAEYYQRKFFEGRLGLKKSNLWAYTWAEYASKQNNAKGFQIIAMIHFYGDGLPKDPYAARARAMRAYQIDKTDVQWHRWFNAAFNEEVFGK